MPVRVEFIQEAVADLVRYAETGNLPLFLKKLLRLEEIGKDAGMPLGRGLAGWRKIVVGDRNWRIIFTVNHDETVATVSVIGDREDAGCYQEAHRRIQALGEGHSASVSLAAAMFQLAEMQRAAKRKRSKR
ncbi:MAG: type II toxin-antitoxin system RelE family toxin [Thermomicrobiales bacterium]